MQLTTRDTKKIFEKLHLEVDTSGHHVKGYLLHDGKVILRLYYSHGNASLPGNVSHKFRRSMRLSIDELRDFLACKMTRERYIEILCRREAT